MTSLVTAAAVYGFFGAVASNLAKLGELANTPKERRPTTLSDPLFLIVQLVLMPLLGGFVAYVYEASGTSLSPILAVNVGASAPLIMKSFASALPPASSREN